MMRRPSYFCPLPAFSGKVGSTQTGMATDEVVQLFFEGHEEFLNIINSGGLMVKFLTKQNRACPLMGTKIKYGRKLGEGNYGVVFEISFPGQPPDRKYVVKKSYVHDLEFIPMYEIALRPDASFLDMQQEQHITAETIITYNDFPFDVTPSDKILDILKKAKRTGLYIPLFAKGCTTAKKVTFKRHDHQGVIDFPAGSYLCPSAYTEYAIATLVGEFYRTGKSINFIDTFYFATCTDGVDAKGGIATTQYTFMEKITGTFGQIGTCVTSTDPRSAKTYILEAAVIQLLHAIATYQSLEISHNDLHHGNVFIDVITAETTWGHSRVRDHDWFEYRIGGIRLRTKAIPFIIKIGDWGMACKFSKPAVLNVEVIKHGFPEPTAILPNFFSPAYDTLYALNILHNYGKSELITRALAWAMGMPISSTHAAVRKRAPDFFGTGAGAKAYRPKVKMLDTKFKHVTPQAILTNPEIMGEFLVADGEGEGKVILLGEL